jgi:pimeloyl-ACP methyl ester carboxylesterase
VIDLDVRKGHAMSQNSTSVILTHGAWADGSSWAKVILPLQQHGLQVIAAPIPLTSEQRRRRTDSRDRKNERAGDSRGACLCGRSHIGRRKRAGEIAGYIAALTPEQGETVGDVFYRGTPHPKAPHLAPDRNDLIWMPDDSFADAFAQNASADMIAILTATQRPIAVPCIQEPGPEAAWKTKPSWFLIAEEDRMINPETQHFMANRMGAKIRPHAVDHTPLVTAPKPVVDVILEAVAASTV